MRLFECTLWPVIGRHCVVGTKLHIESVLLALLLSLPVKSTPFAANDWMDGFLHEWIAEMDGRESVDGGGLVA